jgi:hypothetical protein
VTRASGHCSRICAVFRRAPRPSSARLPFGLERGTASCAAASCTGQARRGPATTRIAGVPSAARAACGEGVALSRIPERDALRCRGSRGAVHAQPHWRLDVAGFEDGTPSGQSPRSRSMSQRGA